MADHFDRLEPVGEGEEYPIVGGPPVPNGFTQTENGWACHVCGALTPRMRQWARLHAAWHAAKDDS